MLTGSPAIESAEAARRGGEAAQPFSVHRGLGTTIHLPSRQSCGVLYVVSLTDNAVRIASSGVVSFGRGFLTGASRSPLKRVASPLRAAHVIGGLTQLWDENGMLECYVQLMGPHR